MKTRVEKVELKSLKLLDLNARYMRHETFQRLADNIKADGCLTQVPFAVWDKESKKYEVLSGNHRVQAGIEAGVTEDFVMLSDDELTVDQKLALQLSHNAIAGEDDPAILQQLYEQMESIDWRIYNGLDDKVLALLEDVKNEPLKEANLEFTTMSLVFLPEEAERMVETWDAIKHLVQKNAWILSMSQYDQVLNSIEMASSAYGVKNVATAMECLMGVFNAHLDDLVEGWINPSGQLRHTHEVPIASVFGSDALEAKRAAIVKRAVDKMVEQGTVPKGNPIEALELWATTWLADN